MATQKANGNGDIQAIRTGFGLFLVSESVVFVTLMAARFLTAGGSVGTWSQGLGVVITLFILISGFATRAARRAIVRGDNAAMQGRLRLGLWFGVLAVAGIFLQWVLLNGQGVPVTAPTAEVYYVITGIWMLFAILSGFGIYAAGVKGRRIGGYTVDDHWNVDGSTYFWEFTCIAWIAMYVVLYFI